MSNVVSIECTLPHRDQVNEYFAKLQNSDPEAKHTAASAADYLIHLGYMVSHLPQEEIENLTRMANEAMA